MRLQDSTDVRRYLASLLVRVEKGEMELRKAEVLSNIVYKIQMSISCEVKEKEIQQMEALTEEMKKLQGGEEQ